jgi:predicted metalloenzyme YecM
VLRPFVTKMVIMINELIGDYTDFITNIDAGLIRLGIRRDELSMMDHVCYRVETRERYQQMLTKCKEIGTLLGESEVNGRMIATFELNDYLKAAGWTVPYLELPEPKEGSSYTEGLEHAELVTIGGLENFLGRHTDLPFTYKGIGKTINPEAGLKTEGISVKFHEQQLGAVVRIEKQLNITKVEQ